MEKKKIYIILSIIIAILIISGIVYINIKENKTIETDGQVIEEENIEESEVDENEINEISDENEPVNENAIDENELKESKVEDEKEVKENKNKYYVKVNNTANVVTIYTKDSEGNYTVPVKTMICSIGTATPKSGKYKLNGTKHRWHTLFGHTPGTYVYGQYTTAIVGNILFHSVPYTTKGDPSTLEYLEYDKLGTKASAGCIRLTVQDAAWIYNNISTGTIVEFYNDSNPGPLGKPSSQKISGNIVCRGWDPTDSDSRNPWRNGGNSTTNNDTSKNEQQKPEEKPQDKPKNNQENKNDENNIINNTIENNVISNNVINNIAINQTVVNNATE
mgnify:CR=1 FL=1